MYVSERLFWTLMVDTAQSREVSSPSISSGHFIRDQLGFFPERVQGVSRPDQVNNDIHPGHQARLFSPDLKVIYEN